MKLMLYSDNHWSQYSSIMRKRGTKYSVRLENQIQSLNWVMQLAEKNNCFATICLGDFFDKSELNSEEISALKDINWAKMTNFFIAGNHEMGMADHSYSSVKLFDLLDTGDVITEAKLLFEAAGTEVYVLPYILEANRKALTEYIPPRTDKKRVILSHNDIAGVQMGKFISEAGFSIDEIHANCDLFINGHLHNGEKIDNSIINIGNLTGQNFSENAFQYDHVVFILDTETLKIEVYENPYAFNFYKIDTTGTTVPNLNNLKSNAVVTLKCFDAKLEYYKQQLSKLENVVEQRVVLQPTVKTISEDLQEELTVDHLAAFRQYMLDNLENTKELMEELSKVLE